MLIRGNRLMCEAVMFHRASATLIVVDVLENIGDHTPGTSRALRFWWKFVFRMWNRPKPAPEYQLGWKDRRAARISFERILAWPFERVVLAHGDLIESDAQETVRRAWRSLLQDARRGRNTAP